MMSDDYEIRRNLPSSTLEALEKEISEVLATCNEFVDKDTKLKLRHLNNGKIFDYDTNTNIEKLAQDMRSILDSFKEYLTNTITPSQEDLRLTKKIREIHEEKLKDKRKLEVPILENKEKTKESAKVKPIQNVASIAEKKISELKTCLEIIAEPSTVSQKSSTTTNKKNKGKGILSAGNKKKFVYKSRSNLPKTMKNIRKGSMGNKSRESSPSIGLKKMESGTSSRIEAVKRTTKPPRSRSKDSRSSLTEQQARTVTPIAERKPKVTPILPQLKPPVIPTIENTIRKSLNLPIPKSQHKTPVLRPRSNSAGPNVSKHSVSSISSKIGSVSSKIGSVSSKIGYSSRIGSGKPSLAKFRSPSSEKPSNCLVTSHTALNNYSKGSSYSVSGSTVSFNSRRRSDAPLTVSKAMYNPLGLLKDEVDEAVAQRKTFTIKGNFPVIRQALLRRGWVEKVQASLRDSTRELKTYLSMTTQELLDLTRLTQTHEVAKKALRSKLLGGGHQPDLYWCSNHDGYYECVDRLKLTLLNKIKYKSISYTSKHGMNTQELLDLIKKPDTKRMASVAVKAKLLAYEQVDLYWSFRYSGYSECPDKNKLTLINRIRWKNLSYTVKHGLCEASRQAFWYHLPGVANLNVPRSYRLAKEGDAEEFVRDFNITAAMSLLKWVKTRSEVQKAKLMTANGRVPLRMFDFAINECYKFLKRARHEDIDQEIKDAFSHEWNEFLEYFYKIIHVGCLFKLETHVTEADMLRRANYILLKLRDYWPYIDMDGELNIWILKPTNSCRGVGIHMCRTLKYVLDTVRSNPNRRYIIQKYIERPLLIYNTKFDIRQWFLISSTVPLTIWIYKTCYLRFSSQTYNLKKLHESIHLTNNSVQCKYKNANHDSRLPTYCMWDSNEFKTYLTGKGQPTAYGRIIYPGMKECITAAVLMHEEHMEKRKNSFELYGADFILTEDFKPWLLEINANPALYPSTPVTARLCPKVLEDVIKVVVDYDRNKNASTGNFELIYKGSVKKDIHCRDEKSLMVNGKPLRPDYFYRYKWSPKEREVETEWGLNKKIKNLSKNPDKTDFGLASVTGVKQTLQSLLELLKKEKERRKALKRRAVIETPPFPSPIGINTWLEKRKCTSS